MRALKFRGKEIQTGEWVYGFYTQGSRIDPIGGEERVRHIIHADMLYDIHPETLGQFTGATDLYGKEVYEGDVVMHDGDPDKEQRVVAFYDQAFGIFTKDEYDDIRKGQNPWLNDYARPTCMNEWTVDGLLKVVGNVYDDDIVPELKESEDERIRKELIKETKGSEVRLFEIVTNEEFIAWLEKQGKQILDNSARTCKDEQTPAWSEEDEKMLKWLCRIVHSQRVKGVITLKEESELGEWMDKWLNHNPHTHWKPSDEQIIALRWVLNNVPYNKHKEEISGLLDQIKEL